MYYIVNSISEALLVILIYTDYMHYKKLTTEPINPYGNIFIFLKSVFLARYVTKCQHNIMTSCQKCKIDVSFSF